MHTRRHFLKSSSAIAAGAGLTSIPLARAFAGSARAAPSDRMNFGLIGCKGMGWANLNSHRKIDGVECIALCDID